MKYLGIAGQASSWADFSSRVQALLTTKAKGDAFEALCIALLRTDPRYVAELKSVWLRGDIPSPVAKRLNLPPADEGIDGIAETRAGEFWSLQCKFLSDPRSTLTKNDLDGFAHLSFTHCKGITKALVLHTSSAPIRKQRLLGVSEIGLREFEGLDEVAWESIRRASSLGSRRAFAHKPRQPRPHQKAAVRAIAEHLKTHDRGRVLMACGTGKSLVGFWVQAALGAKQVVVAVPSLSLLNQTLKEWATEWAARGETVRYTAVCGDESAADIGDSFVEHAYELGIDTYTEETRIAQRLKALRGEHHVVFTTYQSSHRLAAAIKKAKHSFELGILDEAHKTVGERGGRFTTLLDPKVAIRKRIAMTATERVLRGSDDRVLSMDDPQIYGEVAFSYTFKQAIADGVICDYKVITLAVSEARMRALIAANKHLRLHGRGKEDRLRLAQDLAAGELLAKAQSEHGVRHAISFHRSITAASGFAEQWKSVDRMVKRRVRSAAFHVSSKIPTGRRGELLREFRESPSAVITNARCLTEGVDVPNVDAVLFADPRRSTIDIVQAVGRTLRKNPSNPDKIGYVLLPVLVEEGQTVDEFLESSAFREVGRVLAVLSTHDERIAEEFRAADSGGVRIGGSGRIHFAGDVPVGIRFSAQEFVERCGAQVWQRIGRANWRPFEEARDFARSLKLLSGREWSLYCDGKLPDRKPKPADIPSAPWSTYSGKGWTGYGDWLGTFTIAPMLREYRAFTKAAEFARSLGFKSIDEWQRWCKGEYPHLPPRPSDIPTNPGKTYAGAGWESWGDWLGSGEVATYKREYRAFKPARAFVHSLGLKKQNDWWDYTAGRRADLPPLPHDIPASPHNTYEQQGWKGFGDWIGTGSVATADKKYRPFTSARAFVRKLGLASWAEWNSYCAGEVAVKPSLPADIPRAPYQVYSDSGWKGVGDWLGTGRKAPKDRRYRSFKSARAFARGLGLRGKEEWIRFSRGGRRGDSPLPEDVPADPRHVYSGRGWNGWGDWLGVHNRAVSMRPFVAARKFARALRLRSFAEWLRFCKGGFPDRGTLPLDIPKHPESAYQGKGWLGVGDWLGTDRRPRRSAATRVSR
jgi:superfamily II DNA or RNA helicase